MAVLSRMSGLSSTTRMRCARDSEPVSRAIDSLPSSTGAWTFFSSDKAAAIEELLEIAWGGYREARKSPRTQKAGPGFADPNYEISVDWLQARHAIQTAQRRHDDPSRPDCVLLICGAARNDKTCPGEMSKTYRLVQMAKSVFENAKVEVDLALSENAGSAKRALNRRSNSARDIGHSA